MFNIQFIPPRIGKSLRTMLYRMIFRKIGKSVYIPPDFEFKHVKSVEIGDNVSIGSCVRIHKKQPYQSCRMIIKAGAVLDKGADIRCIGAETIEIGEGTEFFPFLKFDPSRKTYLLTRISYGCTVEMFLSQLRIIH